MKQKPLQPDDEQYRILAEIIRVTRRGIWREMLLGMLGKLDALDMTFTQLATLLFLEGEGDVTISRVAAALSRSTAATSRVIDGLVQRGLVRRREDRSDRRARQASLTQAGHALLASIERRRVEAQLAAMEQLSTQERAIVIEGMSLLAQAISRRLTDEQQKQQTEDPG